MLQRGTTIMMMTLREVGLKDKKKKNITRILEEFKSYKYNVWNETIFFFIFDWDIAIFKNLGLLEIIIHEKKTIK